MIGSGVYAGRREKDAGRLLGRGRKVLKTIPLWVFSSGPVGEWTDPEVLPPGASHKARRAGARDHALLGGRVPPEDAGWLVRRVAEKVDPEGEDLRDWDRIRAWAEGIAFELDSPVQAPAVA